MAHKLLRQGSNLLQSFGLRGFSAQPGEKSIESLMAKYPQQAPKKSAPKFPRPERRRPAAGSSDKSFLRSLAPYLIGAVGVTVVLNIGVAAFDSGIQIGSLASR